MLAKPILIAFEGIDGSGKSTQCALLKLNLERNEIPVSLLKAKQRNKEKLFRRFVKEYEIAEDSIAFMFLYQTLHRIQYERSQRELEKGCTVIADRWNASFFVYHDQFGPLAKENAQVRQTIDRLAFEGYSPHVHILLDVPVEVSIQRRLDRGDSINDVANETLFYRKISRHYKQLAKVHKWHIIDGTMPIEQVAREVWRLVSEI